MRRIYKNKSKNCPFSDDFLEGFNSGTEVQFEADVKVLEEIKDEINNIRHQHLFNSVSNETVIDVVLEVLDKHIGGKENE